MADPVFDIANELQLYELGRKLRIVYNSPAWEIITDTIQSYVDNLDYQVRNLLPGSPEVAASHAALYALDQFAKNFQEDVKRAVEFSNNPSPEVREALLGFRDSSDVLKAMEGPALPPPYPVLN